LDRNGDPSGSISCELYSADGSPGSPDTSLAVSTNFINASELPTFDNDIYFDFNFDGVEIIMGTYYYIVLKASQDNDASNYFYSGYDGNGTNAIYQTDDSPVSWTVKDSGAQINYKLHQSRSDFMGLASSTPTLANFLDSEGYNNVNSDDNVNYEVLSNQILDAKNDIEFQYPGNFKDGKFGRSVASGDFNGDGIIDILAGTASSTLHEVYIFFGRTGQPMTAISSADVTLQYPGTDDSVNFGYSVASGDFNGDGYDDALVGAYNADIGSSNEGKAYIFYGSSNLSGPDSSADYTMEDPDNVADDRFGLQVTSGDFNGDGYDDALVGAYWSNIGSNNEGKAHIFYGSSNLSGTDSSADYTMEDPDNVENDYFGYSVYSGDFNGDGYDDALVGAFSADVAGGTGDDDGKAFIFLGESGLSGIESTADYTMEDPDNVAQDYFGVSVSAADFNGDGYDDALVGAYFADVGSSNEGKAHIFYGSSGLSGTDSTADYTMENPNNVSLDYFGWSVTAADFNGDGYDDALVGAYNADIGSDKEGKAYVFYGSSGLSGTDSTADYTLEDPDNVIADNFGYSVYSGDFNGDGYDDALVGAYQADVDAGDNNGKVFLYNGGSFVDNTEYVVITGDTGDSLFGSDNAYAGDVNGDGYDDYIVGDYESNSGTYTDSGGVYLYYGGKTVNTSYLAFYGNEATAGFGVDVDGGDFNGDGYSDIIIGAYAHDAGSSTASDIGQAYIYFGGPNINPASPDVTVSGDYNTIYFGNSVASAGDVNSDGYDDFLVGAPYYPATGTNRGQAYLYYGGATISTSSVITISGSEDNTYLGFDVGSAGDVNADGYADFIVGAYMHDAGSSTAANLGQAYIYLGGPDLDSTADITLSGDNNNARFGTAVAGAGDVNGDGYDDVIVGAYAHNNFGTEDIRWGRAYLYYGGQSMDNIPDFTMLSNEAIARLGLAVNKAGDVNGDGYADIIVGADANDADGTETEDFNNRGQAYVFFGSPHIGTSSNVNSADIIMSGLADNDFLGLDVAYAGDVNGDGYDDFIAGVQEYTGAGMSYLYFGGQSESYPMYSFKNQSLFECNTLNSITATWDGQSTAGAEHKDIKMELFHFGTINAWELATGTSILATSTDGTLIIATTTSLGEYCDANDWSYWRVYQEPTSNFSQIFMTDYWNVDFSYPQATTKPYRMEGTIKIEGEVKFE
ncbi:hypothetical protein DRH27_01545, partial [Candidatus Falkowbacteria bacterium]